MGMFHQPRSTRSTILAQESGRPSMRSLLTILLTIYPLICLGQDAESHHIQPGDLLQISVRGEPNISGPVFVQADGFITVPLLNEIGVAGLTVQQVQTLLVERLQSFVPNPE